MATPVVQALRSSISGELPGNGRIRWLLPGETFENLADNLEAIVGANGALVIRPHSAYATTATLIAMLTSLAPTLPTTRNPALPTLWLNAGIFTYS